MASKKSKKSASKKPAPANYFSQMRTRPQVGGTGACVTTPMAATIISLLGPGEVTEGTALTRDQTEALRKVYGFVPEQPNERPPPPEPKPYPENSTYYERESIDRENKRAKEAWEKWEDPINFMQAGADRNLVRHATNDGLRLVAYLARFVPEGADPMKTLIQALLDAGWDVDPSDVEWAEDEAGEFEKAAAE